jgi:hypothetical protein
LHRVQKGFSDKPGFDSHHRPLIFLYLSIPLYFDPQNSPSYTETDRRMSYELGLFLCRVQMSFSYPLENR